VYNMYIEVEIEEIEILILHNTFNIQGDFLNMLILFLWLNTILV